LKRAPSQDWPRLLTPALGCFPPVAPLRQTERVLHLALYPERNQLDSLACAFKSISSAYAEVDHMRVDGPLEHQGQSVAPPAALFTDARAAWEYSQQQGYAPFSVPVVSTVYRPRDLLKHSQLPDAVFRAAAAINPTLVFMHMQVPSALDNGNVIAKLRALCDPSCVIVQFDGDQHWAPSDWRRQWYTNLGALIDASLTAECHFQDEYATMGVKHPGFLAVGVPDGWDMSFPPEACGNPPLVLLASKWACLEGYESRLDAVTLCADWYGPSGFAVYGNNWGGVDCARPYLEAGQELGAYRDAKAALSVSIRNDITRYTSDRLLRALYAGAVTLVERFPDCEGLGLEHGVNCLLWSGKEELFACCELALRMPLEQSQPIREAAKALGQLHTWQCRMPELLAMVDTVRAERGQ
jgi:hypothetical protein